MLRAASLSKQQRDCLNTCLERLAAQWPIELERLKQKADSFAGMLAQVGISRFEQGTDRCIAERVSMTFPLPGELRSYIPDSDNRFGDSWIPEDEYKDLCREREANPDAFFGYADVQFAWDLKRQNPGMTCEQLISEVLQARKMAEEKANREFGRVR